LDSHHTTATLEQGRPKCFEHCESRAARDERDTMERISFTGHEGLVLIADRAGPKNGLPVVLLHGGGQTRGSWKNGQAALALRGYNVFAVDARGHGESAWSPEGDYSLDALVDDLRGLLGQIAPAAIVGASMGGITALATLGGEAPPPARALVLVDVTPRIDPAGTARIGAFMRAHSDGFATIDDVADAVSAYNPHRPRPRDISGLRRNLREIDGRLYWHWDPAFVARERFSPATFQARLEQAARQVRVPMLLVRGLQSDLVGDAEVAHLRRLVPTVEVADVAGAGHMIAGDRNDAFNAAMMDFLDRLDG
jgi:pimeloyl-ACP methyl ester carboxylesterase